MRSCLEMLSGVYHAGRFPPEMQTVAGFIGPDNQFFCILRGYLCGDDCQATAKLCAENAYPPCLDS
jgi:hypothetical protein